MATVVLCLAGITLAAAPAMAEKRVALAIGNDLDPDLPADHQLRKAANDATTIAGTLRAPGFEVIVGTNWVKFIIDDVRAGNRYPDTAITKLVVNSEPAQ